MAHTTNLGLLQPDQGDLDGTWGTSINNSITALVEQAVAGRETINSWSGNAATLVMTDGSVSTARNMMLKLEDGTGGTALGGAGTLNVPTKTKLYLVHNGSASHAVTVKVSGQTGVAIPVGETALLYCNGADVFSALDFLPLLHVDNLQIDANAITATNTNGGISLIPDGNGEIVVGRSATATTITTNGAGDLVLDTNAGTDTGSITITTGATASTDISIAPSGSGNTGGQTNIARAQLTNGYAAPVSKTANFDLDFASIGTITSVINSPTMALLDASDNFSNVYGATWTVANIGTGIITISVPNNTTLSWLTGASVTSVAGSGSGANEDRKIASGGVVTVFVVSGDTYYMTGTGIS